MAILAKAERMEETLVLLLPSSELLFWRVYILGIHTQISLLLTSSRVFVLKALRGVLMDECFNARETAHLLVGYFEDHFWCPNNSASISDKIVQDLRCYYISLRPYKLGKAAMGKAAMLGSYHVLQTTYEFFHT